MTEKEFDDFLEGAADTLSGGWQALGGKPFDERELGLLEGALSSWLHEHRPEEVPTLR